jgi:hypothetical protein
LTFICLILNLQGCKQKPGIFQEVAEKINNEKTIGLLKTRSKEELASNTAQMILTPIKTYKEHLFCENKPLISREPLWHR